MTDFTYDHDKTWRENFEAQTDRVGWAEWACMTITWPEEIWKGKGSDSVVRHVFAAMLRECGFTVKERRTNNKIQREMPRNAV